MKRISLTLIFFFLFCSVAFGWVSNRIPVRDRADTPNAILGTGHFYSYSKKPYYIDPDGITYDLSEGGTGGSGITEIQTDSGSAGSGPYEGATAVFIHGQQGITTSGTGDTVYVSAEGVHTQVSAWGVSGTTDWSGIVHPSSSGGGSGLTPYSINTMGRTGVSTMGFRGTSGVSYSVGGSTVYGGFTSGITEMITAGVTSWITEGVSAFVSGNTDWSGIEHPSSSGGGSGLTPYSINTMGWTGVSTMGFRGTSGASFSVGGSTVYGGFDSSITEMITEGVTSWITEGVSGFVSGNTDWTGVGDSGTTDAKGFGVIFAGNGTVTSGDSIYMPSPIGGVLEWVTVISDNPVDMTISFDLLRGTNSGDTDFTTANKIINTVTYSTGNTTYVDLGGTTTIAQREYLALQLTEAGGGVSEVSVMIAVRTQGGAEGISQATLTAYTNATAFSGSTGGVTDFVTGSTDWSGVVSSGGGGGSGATLFDTDSGTAQSNAQSHLFVLGGAGIDTSGSGSTAYVLVPASGITDELIDFNTGTKLPILGLIDNSGVSDQFAVTDSGGTLYLVDNASAREALDLEVGIDVLAYDANVVVDGDFTVNGIMMRTGAGAYASGDTNVAAPSGTWSFAGSPLVAADLATSSVGTAEILDGTIISDDMNLTSGGGVTLSGVTAVVITANIFNPDDVVSSVSDNIAIWRVNADKFPNGIILDSVRTQQFGATGYIVNVEEWDTNDSPSVASTIEQMTIAVGTFVEEIRGAAITDRNIAAGGWIFLDLPTTATDQFFIEIKGRIK